MAFVKHISLDIVFSTFEISINIRLVDWATIAFVIAGSCQIAYVIAAETQQQKWTHSRCQLSIINPKFRINSAVGNRKKKNVCGAGCNKSR